MTNKKKTLTKRNAKTSKTSTEFQKCQQCLNTFPTSAFQEGNDVCRDCRGGHHAEANEWQRPIKVLAYDLEVTPLRGYAYSTFQTNIIEIDQPSYILCFSYAWIDLHRDEFEAEVVSLRDFPKTYKKDKTNDVEVVRRLHQLFSDADAVISFNGDNFDHKISRTAFLRHRLTATHQTKSLDVLKILRKYFKMPTVAGSNRLGDVAQFLLDETKLPHDQSLWFSVMNGDDDAHQRMLDYCKVDTSLTVRLWQLVREFHWTCPPLYPRQLGHCPVCNSTHLHRQGWSITKTGRTQRLKCISCGSWSQGIKERFC